MNRSLAPVMFLLFAVFASGCAQQGSSPQSPGQFVAAPAIAPADILPYHFSGGSATASFTAKGKDATCSGTMTFSDNSIYVDVTSTGEVDPGILSSATLTGLSSCDGKPFEFPEIFDLKTGSIKAGKINDVTGVPPDAAIYGSFKMTGTLCDATIHLGRFIASSGGSRVQIDPMNITHVKQSFRC